jgi:ferredoxin
MKMKLISSGKEELKVTEIEIEPEKSVLEMCHKNGIEIRSICKGLPSCAECRVKIAEGEHNVIPPNKAELSLIGSSYYLDQRRLACQLKCFGPVTIDITEQMETRNDSTKKVRGFRLHTPPGGKPVEQVSRAVQDTLVLDSQSHSSPAKPQNQEHRQQHQSQQHQHRHQQARSQSSQQSQENRSNATEHQRARQQHAHNNPNNNSRNQNNDKNKK